MALFSFTYLFHGPEDRSLVQTNLTGWSEGVASATSRRRNRVLAVPRLEILGRFFVPLAVDLIDDKNTTTLLAAE